MNDIEVIERLLVSIDANSSKTSESIEEIKEYMIHNDYRHKATEEKVESLGRDMSILLEMMESRNAMWKAFKKGKLMLSIIIAGILTAAGTGLFNYVTKPVINQHKEKPKVDVKLETKDLIE